MKTTPATVLFIIILALAIAFVGAPVVSAQQQTSAVAQTASTEEGKKIRQNLEWIDESLQKFCAEEGGSKVRMFFYKDTGQCEPAVPEETIDYLEYIIPQPLANAKEARHEEK